MEKYTLRLCLIILFNLICFAAYGQERFTLKGVVYDENRETLPGATVVKKNNAQDGKATDLDGAFSMEVKIGDVLVVSYIGYNTHEYKVSAKTAKVVDITLVPNNVVLDDIVVTGIGTRQRKISVVGAVTKVDTKELQVPATSINNMLGGRVAGVITRQISGEPGENISDFWIRGIGTFGANSGALVLIDGIEGNLNQIDPADIESFSVLKDASATAVYGVRGANGVVIVTTKRGTSDKINITARVNYTISHLTRMPKYVRAYDYAVLANEAKSVRGSLPQYSDIELDIIKNNFDNDLFPDVDWRKEILNDVSTQQTYYVSARGGSNVAKYFLSLGASNESAAYKQDKNSQYKSGTGYNTYNYRANIDLNLSKTSSVYFGVDGWFSTKTSPGVSNTQQLWDLQAMLTPLTIPTRYSTGEIPAYGANGIYSPYVMLNFTGQSKSNDSNNKLTLAFSQDLDFVTKGLKFRAQGAITRSTNYNENRHVLPDMYYATGRYPTGELMLVKKVNKTSAQFSNWQNQYTKSHFESTVTYDNSINTDHKISGLLYYYMSSEKNINDISHESAGYASMTAIPKRYQGISSRISYNLKDIYFVDFNFGYTGSENFKKGHQFGFFPSIAGGWVPTNYEAIKNMMPWFDMLKIRASYGLVGNDRITSRRFPYLTVLSENAGLGWSSPTWNTQNGGGIMESFIGADNLVWEKSKKFNVGFEGLLLNSRLDFTVDIFRDIRDGIFQQRTQVPDYVGLSSMPFGNVGKMKSYGSDGNISYTHPINKDMSFTLRGNYTYTKNMIDSWEQPASKYAYQDYSGWPYQIQRGYISLGLFKNEEDIRNSPKQTFGAYAPGDIKYKDVNGDGKIDSEDQVPLSYPNYPKLMYGFGGEFQYKGLTFGVLFKGTGRNDFYYTQEGRGMGYYPFLNGATGNVLSLLMDQSNRWTPASYSGDPSTENPNARFPRLSYGNNENNTQVSTFWKANAQYLRLQEVSVSYKLTNQYLSKVGLSSIDIQFVGSDLYVWDKIGGLWDPEQAKYNGTKYPIPARYTLQLYFNF